MLKFRMIASLYQNTEPYFAFEVNWTLLLPLHVSLFLVATPETVILGHNLMVTSKFLSLTKIGCIKGGKNVLFCP